ncbi:MAG: IS1182 family transposase [Thermoplasmatales archaeon]|nr:IS1182 family transposase [Thermoplasmatales archaeon]
MSGSYVSGTGRRQLLLLPDMIEHYVEEDNPARFVDTFVDSLDLQELGFTYARLDEGAGRPSYDPHDMLKLYLWGYYNAIRSSRKLETECHRNLEVMWLICKLKPDFKTISDFRKDNIDYMKGVFKAFNEQCLGNDLFGGKTIAIDGTKIKAWNSRDRNYRRDTVEKQIAEMDKKVEKYLKEMDENDAREKDEPKITNMKEKIDSMKKRTEKLRDIKKTMDSEKVDEISLTDPEARLMKTMHGIDVCFNGQISVDQKNHLIVDYDLTNDPTDYASLVPLTGSSREFLGSDGMESLSDRGYFSMENVKALSDQNVDAYIPEARHGMPDKKTGMPKPEFHESRFTYNSEKDLYVCPEKNEMHYLRNQKTVKGKTFRIYSTTACETCPARSGCTESKRGRWIWRWEHQDIIDQHRKKMSLIGHEKMKKRKSMVEHPFGTMKRAMNAGYTLLRGKRRVKGEFGIIALTYNIKRVINIKHAEEGPDIPENTVNRTLFQGFHASTA